MMLWMTPNAIYSVSRTFGQNTELIVKCCIFDRCWYRRNLPETTVSTRISIPERSMMLWACAINLRSHQKRSSACGSDFFSSCNTATTGVTCPPDPPPAARIRIDDLLFITLIRRIARNLKYQTERRGDKYHTCPAKT